MTSASKKKVMLAREKKNSKLRHISLEMETSTHFPALIRCVQLTDGPVLELGSGLFSTPLLHWLCYEKRQILVTCEGYKHYLEFAAKFKTPWHEIRLTDPLKPLNVPGRFSVVFIDHSPKKPRTRGDDAILYKDRADYVVLHDAGKDSNPKYGYENAYKHFKYRWDWEGCYPHTTVLSNVHDLSDFHA